MNKWILGLVIVAVLAVSLGTFGLVYAQSPNPETPVPGTGYGMNGRSARGGMMQSAVGSQDGPLHETMITGFADKLGVSVDDLNTRPGKW